MGWDTMIAVLAARSVRWLPLAVMLAGTLAYANSLSAPFVLDDEDSIVRNPFITSLWPLSRAMDAPPQSSFSGRPLASFSLALSYAAGGLAPSVFRTWNLGILVASALVLFGLVRRTIRRIEHDGASTSAWLALSVALLWLLHPLNTEVVGYVSQRTESMMGLCYLLTLYAVVRAIDQPKRARPWTVAAVVACAAGMACKESMVTAPVMVLLYDAVFAAGSLREALRRRSMLYAGLAATWLVLIALNIDAPRSGSAGFATATSISTYLLNQAVMIITYLNLSFWPHALVLDYGRTQAIEFSTALPYLVAVVALLAAVALAWTKYRALAFLGTWFFITLAPSSSLIPIATEVGAERRMYLPLIAVVVVVLLGLRLATRQVKAAVGTAVALALALATVTFARNRDYQDPIILWQTVLTRHPHGRAHYNMAVALKAAGRSDEAMRHYRDALPGEPAAHYALGFEAAQAGRFPEAVADLEEFLRLRPADAAAPQAGLLLADARTRLGRPVEAEQALRDVLTMAPGFADAIGKLADLQLGQGRFVEAIASYRNYLALMPQSASAQHGLGLALASTQQEALAVPAFEQAVALNPREPQFRMSLGTALAATGRLDQAIVQYRDGLRLAPANAGMMSALAVALADHGDRDESLALFRRALQLAPDDPAIQADFQTALAFLQQRR